MVGPGWDSLHLCPPLGAGLRLIPRRGPHVHIHIVPINTVNDLDFANADTEASDESLDKAAQRIGAALADMGYEPADS